MIGHDQSPSCDNYSQVARIPKKLPRDVNARAVAIARIAIGEDDDRINTRSIAAISVSREKAAKGGTARAAPPYRQGAGGTSARNRTGQNRE